MNKYYENKKETRHKTFLAAGKVAFCRVHATAAGADDLFSASHRHAGSSCSLVCSLTPNMASHCALTQASRPWRRSALSERTLHVFSCFTVCRGGGGRRKIKKGVHRGASLVTFLD